jgi:hypothetical protein
MFCARSGNEFAWRISAVFLERRKQAERAYAGDVRKLFQANRPVGIFHDVILRSLDLPRRRISYSLLQQVAAVVLMAAEKQGHDQLVVLRNPPIRNGEFGGAERLSQMTN